MSDSTRYYLGFSLVNGIGPARLERLVARCGSVAAAWRAAPLELAEAGLEHRLIEELAAARARIDLDAELERAAQAHITLVSQEDEGYPEQLRHIPLPPPLLYVRGALTPADALAVAVVGTRSPTIYGREAAHQIATGLAAAGATVVSGLAIGIDTCAHAAALDAGGRTIAVLACGADMTYPERNQRLAARIEAQGALVSEFPIGTHPVPQLFPVRNRLISGLSRAVAVVEARPDSGALITVDYALDQGRDVFAVPGPIFNPTSEGPHRLLRSGAAVATCAGDILEGLGVAGGVPQREAREELAVTPEERAVLALLSRAPLHVDEAWRASGLAIEQVSAALALLELKGLARQAGPMEYVRA